MGWVDYYNLLLRYHGHIELATPGELRMAAHNNPNNPIDARRIANKKYQEKLKKDEKNRPTI